MCSDLLRAGSLKELNHQGLTCHWHWGQFFAWNQLLSQLILFTPRQPQLQLPPPRKPSSPGARWEMFMDTALAWRRETSLDLRAGRF